jgi:hypothetical protein
VRAAAGGAKILPPLRGAPGAATMLLAHDNVTDIGPAVETFGVQPIKLDDQLRHAASA